MNVAAQIETYMAGQAEKKRDELRELHRLVLGIAPDIRLWFLDGKDSDSKTVSNPNIGYGQQRIDYADGKSRMFYQVGLSANTSGISVYVIGIDDKTWLARTFGERLGKASVTGYCIRFRSLKDVDCAVLEEVIRFGLEPRCGASNPAA